MTLDLDRLLQVPGVDPYNGFDVSPDGKRIAFSWYATGQWEIYELDLDGRSAPRLLTSPPGAKVFPRYSPDGRWLAYAVDMDGSEEFDLYAYDHLDSSHRNLTPNTKEAIQPGFCWSPDGKQIAFSSDKSGRFDTYVMASGGGRARRVVQTPYPDRIARWSPDGRSLLVVSETEGQDFGTFVVPLETGACRSIDLGGRPIDASDSQWSPDSRRIAFASNAAGEYLQIGLCVVETGEVTWATEGRGDKEAPIWSPDGTCLACVVHDGPASSIGVLSLSEGKLRAYKVGTGVHYGPRYVLGGKGLVFAFDNPTMPPDFWLLTLADGSLRQLTHSLPSEMANWPFVMPTQVTYPGLDGRPIPAVLYRPQGVRLPPAVIEIHGGPDWLSQITWDGTIQHMVSRGWAVLAPNYRGSVHSGREWQMANQFDLGGGDTDDVTAGADYLAREGLADPKRIAVTGRSHGGYLTMSCVTRYPERWAAGSAIVPFFNWFTSHERARDDIRHADEAYMGDPVKNRALWEERSPWFFFDRILAPVQLICGTNDVRCPASESIEARDRLLALGKTVDFILYPDEGHAFMKLDTVMDAERRRVAFFARYLEA